MPESFPIERLARKLLWNGLPPDYVSRALRELNEHWHDLKDEALSEGLELAEAEEFATNKVGDPDMLADRIAESMQGASWFARHPVITFSFFPLLAIIAWWGVFGMIAGWTSGAFQWSDNKSLPEPNWMLLQQLIEWGQTGGALSLSLLFCWVASRSSAGFKAAFLACLLLAIHHAFYFADLRPPGSTGNAGFTIGYSMHSNLLLANLSGFFIPLLVFTLFLLTRLRFKTTIEKTNL